MSEFTSKQREVLARKLGYEGPMAGFDEFLQSSPSLMMRYNAVTDKYAQKMANGGFVKKYADGGAVAAEAAPAPAPAAPKYTDDQVLTALDTVMRDGASVADAQKMASSLGIPGDQFNRVVATRTSRDTVSPGGVTAPGAVTYDEKGKPVQGEAAKVTAATTTVTPDMLLDAKKYEQAKPTPVTAQTTTAAPAVSAGKVGSTGYSATTSSGAVKGIAGSLNAAQAGMRDVTAAQGELSAGAIAEAPQIEEAQKVIAPEDRKIEEGELVSGSAVDMDKVEETLNKIEAEQGTVTEEMTVQGQLKRLTEGFDASNPPPWAAPAIRAATAEMAARGLGASSLAGQAILQAALESATPIAAADAQTFKEMGFQNLSNRQQRAMLVGQARATFLGQKFDQEFQTKVVNAAKISDIANLNFTAKQQIALENARLAQSVDIANLNVRSATTLANAAAVASMDMANLNNRQQAAVVNAQNFLQKEIANMNSKNQVNVVKAQMLTEAAMSDAAAINTAKQFNAKSANEAEQFNATLALDAAKFNTAQSNLLGVENTKAANDMAKFNAEMDSSRNRFNAENSRIIDQATAKLLADISTTNTAAINAANSENARNMTSMSNNAYNAEVQLYRDQVKMVFDAYESAEDRVTELAKATMQATAASKAGNAAAWGSLGNLLVKFADTKAGDAVGSAAATFIKGLFGDDITKPSGRDMNPDTGSPTPPEIDTFREIPIHNVVIDPGFGENYGEGENDPYRDGGG